MENWVIIDILQHGPIVECNPILLIIIERKCSSHNSELRTNVHGHSSHHDVNHRGGNSSWQVERLAKKHVKKTKKVMAADQRPIVLTVLCGRATGGGRGAANYADIVRHCRLLNAL